MYHTARRSDELDATEGKRTLEEVCEREELMEATGEGFKEEFRLENGEGLEECKGRTDEL